MADKQIYKYDLKSLYNIFKDAGKSKIFLLTGQSSYSSTGVEDIIKSFPDDVNFSRFIVKNSNPKIHEINEHLEAFLKDDFDAGLAIGGGSVIDTLKCIKAFSEKNDLFTVTAPTTAGSGSEATPFAVYYDEYGKKQSIDKPFLLPNAVILDGKMLLSLPKYQKACTAMDALCQALESYWAVGANDESEAYALEAMEIILSNIIQYVNSPDTNNCISMLKGANLAGKAIAITRTTLSHALSYTITSNWGIPHGHAVALTIGSVFKYNTPCIAEYKLEKLAEVFSCEHYSRIPQVISSIMTAISLKTTFSQLKIDDINTIAKGINAQRMGNNPRLPSNEDIIKILEEIK